METKNTIINDYASAVSGMGVEIAFRASTLTDNLERNRAIITTLYNEVETLKNEIVLLMGALDNYNN